MPCRAMWAPFAAGDRVDEAAGEQDNRRDVVTSS
jgi:hypothetical protein